MLCKQHKKYKLCFPNLFMIIGITGTAFSGKSSVVDFLVEKGFKHYSVNYFLEEEIQKRGLIITEETMSAIREQINSLNHPGFVGEKLYEKAKIAGGDCIIEPITTIGELEILKAKEDFYLIAVDAESKIRYNRSIEKKDELDVITYDEFLEEENEELLSYDISKQNLGRCIELADFIILNNGSVDELHKEINKIFGEIGTDKKEIKTLSEDEFFLGVAILAGKRSKDPNPKNGSCLVNGFGKIIGIGWNCFPEGCLDNEPLRLKENFVCPSQLNSLLNSPTGSAQGSTMYVGIFPCLECAKGIIQAGVKKIFYLEENELNSSKEAKEILNLAGVKYEQKIPKEDKIELEF